MLTQHAHIIIVDDEYALATNVTMHLVNHSPPRSAMKLQTMPAMNAPDDAKEAAVTAMNTSVYTAPMNRVPVCITLSTMLPSMYAVMTPMIANNTENIIRLIILVIISVRLRRAEILRSLTLSC